jgi:hypothetical protein
MMYAQLKRELAVAMAPNVMAAFGLSQEDRIVEALAGFLDEPLATVLIERLVEDLADQMDIMSAPWDDPNWYDEGQG